MPIDRMPNYKKKDYVHIAKLPDQFRGKFRSDDPDPGLQYAQEVPDHVLITLYKWYKIPGGESDTCCRGQG